MSPAKRHILSSGRGYLSAAGPQARFIAFLLAVLVAYTFILLLFRKLAEVLQLPLFFPLSLVILVLFVGVAGTVSSHKFVGPLARLRQAVDQLADGDTAATMRVRDADDPILKDLARSLSRLADHHRHSLAHARSAASDCASAAEALRTAADRGATGEELGTLAAELLERLAQAERAFQPRRRPDSEVTHG